MKYLILLSCIVSVACTPPPPMIRHAGTINDLAQIAPNPARVGDPLKLVRMNQIDNIHHGKAPLEGWRIGSVWLVIDSIVRDTIFTKIPNLRPGEYEVALEEGSTRSVRGGNATVAVEKLKIIP